MCSPIGLAAQKPGFRRFQFTFKYRCRQCCCHIIDTSFYFTIFNIYIKMIGWQNTSTILIQIFFPITLHQQIQQTTLQKQQVSQNNLATTNNTQIKKKNSTQLQNHTINQLPSSNIEKMITFINFISNPHNLTITTKNCILFTISKCQRLSCILNILSYQYFVLKFVAQILRYFQPNKFNQYQQNKRFRFYPKVNIQIITQQDIIKT
eukprot:TRINITY_DN4688_c0_g1_i9.p1 TRINITY_DN4688_c0_g1~~TRINITY_DN4688_c0_g1_i9.p1  ORF type:complete len:207 (+),score=-20.76 TRINITY_DN4688_c0_g1_i9:47-667(+)